MRIVLDTNILVAGARSRKGASYQLLQLIPDPRFQICRSLPLYLEYLDVLSRPEIKPVGLSMNQIYGTVRLPDSLHREIKRLVEVEGISINQFLTLAAAEKISALRTVEYLRMEGAKGKRADFDAFLAAVPDIEPDDEDKLE